MVKLRRRGDFVQLEVGEDLRKAMTALQSLSHVQNVHIRIPLGGRDLAQMRAAVKAFASQGYGNPAVRTNSRLGPCPLSLLLSRSDDPPELSVQRALYVLEHGPRARGCSVSCKFDHRAIKFLHGCRLGDKERGGSLRIVNVHGKGSRRTFVIGVDEKSVQGGQLEGISLRPSRYNFHSHPQDAYLKHSVDVAWPSLKDYMGLLTLGNRTIFHVVATMEGLYIMSFGPHWVERLKGVSKAFVRENYDVGYRRDLRPEEYARTVRAIKYKGFALFNVIYFPWGSAGTLFTVRFKARNGTCEL